MGVDGREVVHDKPLYIVEFHGAHEPRVTVIEQLIPESRAIDPGTKSDRALIPNG
jgi:hypothetical protein